MDKSGFFETFKPRAKRVDLPEGRCVFVRALSLEERDRFENDCFQGTIKNLENFRARFLVLAIADTEGQRLLGEEDLAALGRLPCGDLELVFETAYEFSCMSKEALAELKKNSAAGGASGSDSTSASPSA